MKKLTLETILNESRWVAKMTYGRHVGTYEELERWGYLSSEELRDVDVTVKQPDHLQGFFDDMWEYEKDHEWMTIQEFYEIWKDMPEKIRAIVKEPNKPAEVKRIENTLESMQEIVEGYIEAVTVTPDMIIICNEEGRIKDLPYNCVIADNEWYGTVMIVGSDGEEFADVPQYIVDMFNNDDQEEEPKLTCPVCGRDYYRSEMDFTYDCHGIPFRLVCYECLEALMAEKGYDGEYYTSADENIWDDEDEYSRNHCFPQELDDDEGWDDHDMDREIAKEYADYDNRGGWRQDAWDDAMAMHAYEMGR